MKAGSRPLEFERIDEAPKKPSAADLESWLFLVAVGYRTTPSQTWHCRWIGHTTKPRRTVAFG